MKKLLDNLNGVYIPGDDREANENLVYIGAVDKIIQYSQKRNLDDNIHFPLVATGYGFLSLVKI